jgi:hypothetical protein
VRGTGARRLKSGRGRGLGFAYRRHLPWREGDEFIETGLRDVVGVPDMGADERRGALPDDIIVEDVAAREVSPMAAGERAGELLAVDQYTVAFC